jgi:cytochrome c oxidase subunit 4
MRSRGWLKMKRAGETAGVPNGLYLAIPGEDSAHGDAGSHTRLYLIIWGWLIALTAVEVVLGYIHLSSLALMLVILMGISIVKAALIMAYFMHLKSERMSLVLTIVPAMVVIISLLAIFFPDSLRALNLRAFR